MVANLSLPAPAAVGDEWGNSLNTAVQGVNTDVETLKGRTIATGLGLLGGGSLAANRSLSIDFAASGAVSDTKAVRADDSRLSDARPLAGVITEAGLPNRIRSNPVTYRTTFDGLLETGWYAVAPPATSKPPGGDYWYLRVEAYEATSVTQTAWEAGVGVPGVEYRRVYGSAGGWTAWTKMPQTEAALDARYALAARSVSAGSGLTGGGDLSANRSLAVDFATTTPLGPAAVGAVGTATKPARADHVHPVPAWANWTPTFAGDNGAAVTCTVSQAARTVIGKTALYRLAFTVTSIGSATGNLNVTNMTQTAWAQIGAGRDNSLGPMLQTEVNGTNLNIKKYDNASILVAGKTMTVSGSYEVV